MRKITPSESGRGVAPGEAEDEAGVDTKEKGRRRRKRARRPISRKKGSARETFAGDAVGVGAGDGGVTAQAFLAAGCLTDLTVTVIPTLLGRGRRLFGDAGRDVALTYLSSQAFPFGFVQNTYRVNPAG